LYSGLGRLVVKESTSRSDTSTLGRNPLDEGSVRRRDIYLTAHTTFTRDRHQSSGGIRTRKPGKRAAEDPRLRARGRRQEHRR